MRKILLSIISCIFLACNTNQKADNYANDSSLSASDSQKVLENYYATSPLYNPTDTSGVYLAPVKILSAVPEKQDYSSYKNIRITYKNVSGKNIDAIKFRWYGKNAFGEPADMGGIIKGQGQGFTDELLMSNKKTYNTFGINSQDLKTVTFAYPYEVAFADGTKWKLK